MRDTLKGRGVKVPLHQAENLLDQLRSLRLQSQEAKPRKAEGELLVPLAREPTQAEKDELVQAFPKLSFELAQFKARARTPRKLVDFLADELPPHLVASIPRSYDIIGDIAILEIPEELVPHEEMLASAIRRYEKNVRLIVKKVGPVHDRFRVRDFAALAGSGPTETVHREHGCLYKLDINKAFFSPRLSYEHLRVASLVGRGERVLDMFSGVGGFSILIAKKGKAERVDAVDINPDAFRFLKENILLNRVVGRIHAFLGDVREFIAAHALKNQDRVIMNLPAEASAFVEDACRALKPEGGMIHYYTFASMPEPMETAKNEILGRVAESGRRAMIAGARFVKETAPYAYQVAVDVKVEP